MKLRFASELEIEEFLVINDLRLVGTTIIDQGGANVGQLYELEAAVEESALGRRWWPASTEDTPEQDVSASARSRLSRLSRSYRAA